MILGIYTICDIATSYLPPFYSMSDEAAIRQFKVEINSNPLSKTQPADFTLYKIGEYNNEDGCISRLNEQKKLKNGMEVLERNNE